MKKLLLLALVFVVGFMGNVFAAKSISETATASKQIAIVLFANAEYKNKSYYNLAEKIPDVAKDASYTIKIGDEVQGEYERYCSDHMLLATDIPKETDMTGFAAEKGYDRVLLLVMPSPIIHEWSQEDYGHPMGRGYASANIRLSGYLYDNAKVLKFYSTSASHKSADDWGRDYHVRATTGAFKSCCRNLGKAFKGLW